MKKYFNILILFLVFASCKAQTIVNTNTYSPQTRGGGKYFKDIDNNFAKFTGTWENVTGNLTFRVVLIKETKSPYYKKLNDTNPFYYKDIIRGRFMMIENAGEINEVILYNSVQYYAINNYTSQNSILGFTRDGVRLGGSIEDNCVSNSSDTLTGRLSMIITNPGAPIPTAQWKVERKGMRIQGEVFRVPENIILTKIN